MEKIVPTQFNSPEEELQYLRERVAKHEQALNARKEIFTKHAPAMEVIRDYTNTDQEHVLHPSFSLPKQEIKKIALDLAPETHDDQITELAHLIVQKGIHNTLNVLQAMQNPHIEDDFVRYLIEYIKEGHQVDGLKEKSPLAKSLRMTLYEINLPERTATEEEPPLKELISSMEQFYAGMLSVGSADENSASYFTIELAVANNSDEFIFYAGIPDSKKELFEKQILSIFPKAKISIRKDDYNIFNESGESVASYAVSKNNPIFPLKLYEQFDHDPLNVVLNSFSKIDKDGEGAAIQIVFQPARDAYVKKYTEALKKIQKGMKVKEAIDIPESAGEHIFHAAKDVFKILASKPKKKEKDEESRSDQKKPVDDKVIESITEKIASPIMSTNIRIVASSHTRSQAEDILSHIESAFNQFENTRGNGLKFTRVSSKKLNALFHDFSFRLFDDNQNVPLNITELTTMMHFPASVITAAPQLKVAKAGHAPVPVDMPQSGTLLGINRHQNAQTEVRIAPDDRLRHFYVIGQTGTGKSTLLKNMIIQDIQEGKGVCMIDPHGADIIDVLGAVPKNRYEDVVYFDPSYTERPMALNMLEYDIRFPEQKTFVVNELLSIFDKLFDMKVAGGPMFEQYFRNSVLLVMEDPESGNTLLDVARVLADKKFRDMKLERCKNPIVVQYWREVAEKAGGEAALANIVPYITSKFDVFLSNDIMRPVIAQEKSSFNFRQIMDEKKILLVNLSKGRLGDLNANLIGLILVGKILMAALSRVDSLGKDLPAFYLYIDEFQNVTTNSIATILSEARKYKLSLNIAHQFIAQLDEKIRDAVFGNVGSIAAFRVGADDAEYLEKQFSPVFTAKDLMNIDNRNAYMKMLVNGVPTKAFSIETVAPPKTDTSKTDLLKELSYAKYGEDRAEVEASIMEKYKL